VAMLAIPSWIIFGRLETDKAERHEQYMTVSVIQFGNAKLKARRAKLFKFEAEAPTGSSRGRKRISHCIEHFMFCIMSLALSAPVILQ
jgi:hypothetical protein